MNEKEVWLDLLQDFGNATHKAIAVLPLDALSWRPDEGANSIAVTMWHIARLLDVLRTRVLANRPPQEEAWHTAGWGDKTGYDPTGIGAGGLGLLTGYTSEQVAQVPVLPADDLLAYFDQAHAALGDLLLDLPLDQLHDRAAGRPESERSAYSWIKGFLIDAREHLGEIKALRAMWERRKHDATL